MLQLDQYAISPASPDALWSLVGDLRRLPEWTDVTAVSDVPEQPYAVKDTFVTHRDDQRLSWMVITVGPRLLEAKTDLPRGRLGLGVRVVSDPAGSRLVLAALYDPSEARWRARLVDLPALRRRFDRWMDVAVRSA